MLKVLDELGSSSEEEKEIEHELHFKMGSGQKFHFDITDLCKFSLNEPKPASL